MTTVNLLQKEINHASREIDKCHAIGRKLEVDKVILEDKLGSIKEFIDANAEDIVKREREQKILIAKLKKAKQEIEPLQGQLAFINTGYRELILI